MLEKIVTFEVALFPILSLEYVTFRKQLIEFLFWFWHRKNDTRLYSYTSSTKCSRVKYASFYHCRKWSPMLFVVKNWYSILIEPINKSVKSILRHRILIYFKRNFFQWGISSNNQIMSSQHIPHELPGHLFCFLLYFFTTVYQDMAM